MCLLTADCSSLRSLYSMVPVQETGWQIISDRAVFRDGTHEIQVYVPLSGSWQHSMGPCLLPVLPVTRDFPRPLEIWVDVKSSNAKGIELEGSDWLATLRAQEFGETFPDDYEIKSRVASLTREKLSEDELRYRLTFSQFDNEFEDFSVQGALKVNGKRVAVPSIQFERQSDLDYTPFTTKILDLI